MRSKPKARKLTQDEEEPFENPSEAAAPLQGDMNGDAVLHSDSDCSQHEDAPCMKPSDHPVYIPEDIPIPQDFELRESKVISGLGVWTKVKISAGQKFGPFAGVLKTSVEDRSAAWELVDEFGKVKGWIDAGEPGTGNWLKYVRSAADPVQQNIMAVQVEDQVFYKAIRDIEPTEEMLLYARDAVYPERDLDAMHKSMEEELQHVCDRCHECFRSKVALRRHQTYVCNNSNAIFSTINKDFKDNGGSHDNSLASSEDLSMVRKTSVDSGDEGKASMGSMAWSHSGKLELTPLGKQFLCENCDKVFTDPSNLQRHIRSQHVGARSHACTECGKTFATSSGLKQHQHIHSSVKPFQCEVCLKAYTQFSNLCRHKRMHADCRQQIKCKDCGQAFSTMTSLSKHKRFCEGMMRNGARFGYPGTVPPPQDAKAPALNPANQAAALTAAYMNLYGPRPPFPFYPPLGAGYPIFPPGHPLAAMTPPVHPDTKLPTSVTQKMALSHHQPLPHKMESKEDKHGSEGSEGSLSDVSTGSDIDTTTGSDVESECSTEKKSNHSPKISSPATKMEKLMSHKSPKAHSKSDTHAQPCDLSMKEERKPPTPVTKAFHLTKTSTPKGSESGEQPLDLSTKAVITQDTPRKTHIFGEARRSLEMIDRKLHAAYPMPNPMILDPMYRVDSDKLQSFQDAARMMAFGPRFAIPNPAFNPMAGLGPMRPDAPKPFPHHMMKMEKTADAFHYSAGPNKLKERYSCKFCGKIFPRSANLTRHLRTHTGEQPYKCKYCERSFSISSNLQRHVRNIHNKEKPFKCPLCDRCFGQQTNLDRHLKKHESDGPNVIDSPSHAEHELEDKDESYFDEIRNFIGRATEGSPQKDYENIDANFSITAQIEKQSKISERVEEGASLAKKARFENNNLDERENGLRDLPNGYHAESDGESSVSSLSPVAKTPLACST